MDPGDPKTSATLLISMVWFGFREARTRAPVRPGACRPGENPQGLQQKHSHTPEEGSKLCLLENDYRRGQCCGSGSGIRCLFDPWIRVPGWVESQHPDPGSGMNNPLMRIRDPGWKKAATLDAGQKRVAFFFLLKMVYLDKSLNFCTKF